MQHPRRNHEPRPGRLRRWLIGAGLFTLLALAYGVGLSWFAQRLGEDVEKSVRMPETSGNGAVSPR